MFLAALMSRSCRVRQDGPEARRARRGCLIGPQSLPEGDLIGVRLPRSVTGEPVRPGRALLNTGDGNLVTVTVLSG